MFDWIFATNAAILPALRHFLLACSVGPRTSGGDIFFTELFKIDDEGLAHWESDGGVASYNPTVYEEQRVSIPSGSSGRYRGRPALEGFGDPIFIPSSKPVGLEVLHFLKTLVESTLDVQYIVLDTLAEGFLKGTMP